MDQRKLALWRRRLARQEASGLTVAAFCRRERVSVSLWKYWQRQVERETAVVSVVPAAGREKWVRIDATQLAMILGGVRLESVQRRKRYQRIGA